MFKYSLDIQPPEMNNCPDNITKFSSEPVTYINWTAPTFADPVGKLIRISTNYPQNSFNFPWGDFRVQYVALKPSNGMRTSCVFTLKIRRKYFPFFSSDFIVWIWIVWIYNLNLIIIVINVAHPCKPLATPENGAKVCNGWKKDYGEFCLAFCGPTYSLDIRYSHQQWYVCGTSGQWIPKSLPNCTGYNSHSNSIICLKALLSKWNLFWSFTLFQID